MLTSMSANAEQEVCLHSRHRVKKIYKVTYYRITVLPYYRISCSAYATTLSNKEVGVCTGKDRER